MNIVLEETDMIYSDVFMTQWKKLCKDFSMNIQKRKDGGLTPKKLDEWYQLNILRWESSIETEGVALEQQNNRELRNNLLVKLKNFRFKEVPMIIDQKAALSGSILVVGVLVLAILGNVLLPIPKKWGIILAVVVIAVAVMEALKMVQKSKEKEYARRRTKYEEQLSSYGNELLALCKTYEKDIDH